VNTAVRGTICDPSRAAHAAIGCCEVINDEAISVDSHSGI
jgi:hypothetical protein